MLSKNNKHVNPQTMKLFREIAYKNVKTNIKNYVIYFLTLTLGVALFYTFNSLYAQFSMMNLKDDGSYLTFAAGMILAVSLFICVIMGFLVSYANRFLMRKRKKELGIYSTLGIDQRMLTKLIQRETLLIGAGALAAGLLAGVFLSQGLALITMRILNVASASYAFVFSPLAAVGAVVFFGLLFMVIYLVNKRNLKKQKLIDLLYADRKNETVKERRLGSNLLIGALGIGLGIAGYLLILLPGYFKLKQAGAGILLIAIGIFFLFWSISGVLLGMCKKNKKKYYKGINLFTIAQIASKLKTTNVSLSIICILLFLSISSMTIGLGMAKSISQDLEVLTSYDATISKIKTEQVSNRQYQKTQIAKELKRLGVDLNSIAKEQGQVSVYEPRDTVILGEKVSVISLSDFNQARKLQGLKPVTLAKGKFLLCNIDREHTAAYEKFLSQKEATITVNGSIFTSESKKLVHMSYFISNASDGNGTVIVEDSAVKKLTPSIISLNLNYKGDKEAADNALRSVRSDIEAQNFMMTTKDMVIIDLTSSNLMLSYMAIYFGITFMICACVVLALQQMGEAEDNKKRYGSLRKLGIRTSHIHRSIRQQVGIYFGFPLIVAVLHSAVITIGMYQMMPPMGFAATFYNILFAVIVTGIVYGSYFFLTYLSGKNAAEE